MDEGRGQRKEDGRWTRDDGFPGLEFDGKGFLDIMLDKL